MKYIVSVLRNFVFLSLTITFCSFNANAGILTKDDELSQKLIDVKDTLYTVSEWKAFADEGNKVAQAQYGLILMKGERTEKDCKQSKLYLEKSSEQGFHLGYAGMALLHIEGCGVEKSTSKARDYLIKACINGWDSGCRRYKDM
ncbi:tetratricopeptide repeat protein [Providencia rettgeri]